MTYDPQLDELYLKCDKILSPRSRIQLLYIHEQCLEANDIDSIINLCKTIERYNTEKDCPIISFKFKDKYDSYYVLTIVVDEIEVETFEMPYVPRNRSKGKGCVII